MLLRKIPWLAFLLALPIAACGQTHRGGAIDVSSLKEAWDAENDPLNLADRYEVHFAALPMRAELEQKPWSDSYWPNMQGGLAYRWNASDDPNADPDAWSYALHSATEVAAMSLDDLAILSPAEKYDILLGRYDYPLTSSERGRTKKTDAFWYGLCHGWAPASLNFKEPHPVVAKSGRGVQVPFGASDVKALLLYAQQDGADTRFAGRRCADARGPHCRDVNPGSFHIILANQIGQLQQGFVADIGRERSQIWNQPVFGYTSTVLGESTDVYARAARGTVKIVKVRTQMLYVSETEPSWDPLPLDRYPELKTSKTYEYTLELGRDGAILGGEWSAASEHPDFLWTQSAPELTGFFSALKGLYEESTSG